MSSQHTLSFLLHRMIEVSVLEPFSLKIISCLIFFTITQVFQWVKIVYIYGQVSSHTELQLPVTF